MRILNDSVLRERYDVAVVGAGLGGLSAASLLAKRGLSVLMIDNQARPGGGCSSFKRDDVVFDAGTAMLYGFGEKGFRPFRFLMNELEQPVEVVAHPTLARITIEGRPLTFWPDLERFLDDLGAMFPRDRDALRRFYADLRKLYENIVVKNEIIVPPSEITPKEGLRRLLSDPLNVVKMQKLLSTSVLDLLAPYGLSEEAIDFFDKLCSAYCYTTAAETPAVLAATMFLDNHVGGAYYPAGGAQMLSNRIEQALERDGGQTLYGHRVDEILIGAQGAYGVRLASGTQILADRVVADATVWNLYGKLVRPKHIKPERLAWAQSLVPTYPSMTMYMLVDAAAIPAGTLPWEVFIEEREGVTQSDLTLYINSLVDTTLAPPGMLAITAIAPNLQRWPAPTDPAYRSPEYQVLKQQETERALDQIEQHFPGFRSHLRVCITGTPSTIERYLLKNGGAVGGPKNQIGQEMLKRLHARSEWKNLYVCGDSTVMATGAPAAVVSGVGAANMVLRDLRQSEYEPRKFARSYIRFVDLPYRRPAYHGEPLTLENAHLASAQCQWCEDRPCRTACPARVDIPGFLRRMEVQNWAGAARRIRERNPLGEVCGYTCGPDAPCQRQCYRTEFAGTPVRIPELQRLACEAAGEAGWPALDTAQVDRWMATYGKVRQDIKCAMVGAGAAAWSCAYYLALAGRSVEVYDLAPEPDQRPPAGWPQPRLQGVPPQAGLQAAIRRDLAGILRAGVKYRSVAEDELRELLRVYARTWDSPYWALAFEPSAAAYIAEALKVKWPPEVEPSKGGTPGRFGGYALGPLEPPDPSSAQAPRSVVQAAADGRRVAIRILVNVPR